MLRTILSLSSILLLLCILSLACGNETTESTPIATAEEPKPATPKQPMSEGQRLFLLCQACHSLKEGEPHKTGPNLYQIFGRKAGTAEGYANYSDAVKNSGIIWDETQLKSWLAKPTDFLPGTAMAFIGIEDPEKQQILIDYLKEQTR